MISQAISHYRIIKKLGAGGMGEVYLAEDTQLDRRVAIKFLRPESTADEQAKKRLVREARAAAKLDHPNICSIYEVVEEDGRAFIVMQYVEGETLASRMRSKPLEYFLERGRAPRVKVETGVCQAEMKVSLVNDGPVTILLDSKKLF